MLAVKDASDKCVTARVVVEYPGGQAGSVNPRSRTASVGDSPSARMPGRVCEKVELVIRVSLSLTS
jgi:hypothetical protein